MEKAAFTSEYRAMLKLLRSKRQDAGATQIDLAEKLGMTQSAYSKLERGELRLDVIQLRMICLAVGISLTSFVTELENRMPKPSSRKKRRSNRKS